MVLAPRDPGRGGAVKYGKSCKTQPWHGCIVHGRNVGSTIQEQTATRRIHRQRAESKLLLISEAVARLKAGMYGNFDRPEAVKEAKKHYPRASIGFGPQKEDAARIIDNALMKGELSVLVLLESAEGEVSEVPLQVPPDVLKKMIRTRDGLPDRTIEPRRIFAKDRVAPELLAALSTSELYVRSKEFEAWYDEDRKKLKWPSQRSSRKPRMGRPSRQSDFRTPIVAMVNEGRWSAEKNSIADLVRLLSSRGMTASRQTVDRVVAVVWPPERPSGQSALSPAPHGSRRQEVQARPGGAT
jgi:hypothetical protein